MANIRRLVGARRVIRDLPENLSWRSEWFRAQSPIIVLRRGEKLRRHNVATMRYVTWCKGRGTL